MRHPFRRLKRCTFAGLGGETCVELLTNGLRYRVDLWLPNWWKQRIILPALRLHYDDAAAAEERYQRAIRDQTGPTARAAL